MPAKFSHLPQRRRGFTLVEIMIVVAILGIIVAIAVTTSIRQRHLAQARSCQENLSKIAGAKEQWALENNRDAASVPGWDDLVVSDGSGYLHKQPRCPADGDYAINVLSQLPTCTITAPIDHNAQP